MLAEIEVRARLDRFVTDLTELIRSATVEAFEEALEAQRAESRSTLRATRASRARDRGLVAVAQRAKGDAETLDQTAEKLAVHASNGASEPTDENAPALEAATEDGLPTKKPREKRVKTTGGKRSKKNRSSDKRAPGQLSLPFE